MSSPTDDKRTVTKRDLASRVRIAIKPEISLHQTQVSEVITETLDAIRDSLVNGNTVELRNFGVFKIETRKQRIGRNPKQPPKSEKNNVYTHIPGKFCEKPTKAAIAKLVRFVTTCFTSLS